MVQFDQFMIKIPIKNKGKVLPDKI